MSIQEDKICAPSLSAQAHGCAHEHASHDQASYCMYLLISMSVITRPSGWRHIHCSGVYLEHHHLTSQLFLSLFHATMSTARDSVFRTKLLSFCQPAELPLQAFGPSRDIVSNFWVLQQSSFCFCCDKGCVAWQTMQQLHTAVGCQADLHNILLSAHCPVQLSILCPLYNDSCNISGYQ